MRLKKRYILNLDGEDITAEITSDPKGVEVQLAHAPDGPLDVRLVFGGQAWSVRRGNRHFLIYLTSLDDKGTIAATLDGRPQLLTAMDEMRAMALSEIDQQDGGGTLMADIPGLIVEIKVSCGQRVKRGEPVIVLEAMKMQNELGAGIDGTITKIAVEVGQAVNPGDPLVIIEPDPV